MQAHLKIQICSSTLAVKLYSLSVASLTVKLCCRSIAASTLAASKLAVKLRVRLQQSLESTRSFDRTRSFPLSKLRPLRYTYSFSFFRRNRSTVVASLRRADVSVTRLGNHFREFGGKPCSHSALISPLGEVRAPIETEVSARTPELYEAGPSKLVRLSITVRQSSGQHTLTRFKLPLSHDGARPASRVLMLC